MRRSIATLLVVASPFLMAAPVTAEDARSAGPVAPEPVAAPEARPPAPAATTLALPVPVEGTAPDGTRSPLATPAPAVAAPVPAPAAVSKLPAPVRSVAPVPAAGTPGVVAAASDAAYAERLAAELCAARQVFCGLTRDGRYPARP